MRSLPSVPIAFCAALTVIAFLAACQGDTVAANDSATSETTEKKKPETKENEAQSATDEAKTNETQTKNTEGGEEETKNNAETSKTNTAKPEDSSDSAKKENTQQPKNVTLSGTVHVAKKDKHGKPSQLSLRTSEKTFLIKNDKESESLKKYIGKSITVTGTATDTADKPLFDVSSVKANAKSKAEDQKG